MKDPTDQETSDLARKVAERLHLSGFCAYLAGGCVRDLLMGRTPKDYDIATDATPDQVLALFPGSVSVGKAFGVIRARVDGSFFDVATFRRDHAYADGRRPTAVSFTDAQTDALRRDFTINALFYDPLSDQILDFADGRRDLERKIIRCVGDPVARFAEDHLRMLRAIRFAATLGFEIEPDTAEAIRLRAADIEKVSPERIREELTRLLIESNAPGDALGELDRHGLLSRILPEVAATKGQEQPPEFHPEGDVFRHTVIMLNLMAKPTTARLAYSALLHDIGKPPCARREDGRLRFNGHAEEVAEMASRLLRRLRFATDDVEFVSRCIRNHMRFIHVTDMKRSTLRRLIGADTFETELELHRLDCLASHGMLDNHRFLVEYRSRMAREPVLPDPWVSGTDLIAMGIPEGREVGLWKRTAYEAQLDGQIRSREELLEWLQRRVRAARTSSRKAGRQSVKRSSAPRRSPQDRHAAG